MQDQTYFTTEEAATYLRIKERKLYELVATEVVPCSKVSGKWLFPRAALDRWVMSGMIGMAGIGFSPPPAIIGGSHDLLLDWTARQSGSGLALLSEGSQAGLTRLGSNDIALAAIHFHDDGADMDGNLRAVTAQILMPDVVVIAFAKREQGLVLAPGNPQKLTSLQDVISAKARFGLRQKGAGALMLLQRLLATAGENITSLKTATTPYPTGQDLALGIRSGEIDCGIATRAIAAVQGLEFLSLAWERFDLAMRQSTYFQPGPQALFTLMRHAHFARQAKVLGGYDVSEVGRVLLSR